MLESDPSLNMKLLYASPTHRHPTSRPFLVQLAPLIREDTCLGTSAIGSLSWCWHLLSSGENLMTDLMRIPWQELIWVGEIPWSDRKSARDFWVRPTLQSPQRIMLMCLTLLDPDSQHSHNKDSFPGHGPWVGVGRINHIQILVSLSPSKGALKAPWIFILQGRLWIFSS